MIKYQKMKIDNVWFKFKNINEKKKCRDTQIRSVSMYYTHNRGNSKCVCRLQSLE